MLAGGLAAASCMMYFKDLPDWLLLIVMLVTSCLCGALWGLIPAFFKQHGYRVACAGIRDSVSLYEADLAKPLLLVIGGEKRGISRAVLEQADLTVRIDYQSDFHGSLSAAAATAVLAFEVVRQNQKS